ncbi:hypothetical protein DIPPA_06902 [Diplonema papillatum]|nr:hypothetical protein DIPPA_06902 [Diplonema papillatum]KAJ9472584.1 hypothetical protein DIPPA_06902 [Diplonema papillatum]
MEDELDIPEDHIAADWGSATVYTITKDPTEKLGMTLRKDLVVKAIAPGSPAERAGMEKGLLVTAVNGKPVTSLSNLSRSIVEGGDEFTVTVKRYYLYQEDSEVADTGIREVRISKAAGDDLGLIMNADMGVEKMGFKGALWNSGVRRGAVLLQINDEIMSSPEVAMDFLTGSEELVIKFRDPERKGKGKKGKKDGKKGSKKGGKDFESSGWKGEKGGEKGAKKGKKGKGGKDGKPRYEPYAPAPWERSKRFSNQTFTPELPPTSYNETYYEPASSFASALAPIILPPAQPKVSHSKFVRAADQRFPNMLPPSAIQYYQDTDFETWASKSIGDLQQELQTLGVESAAAAPLQNLARSVFTGQQQQQQQQAAPAHNPSGSRSFAPYGDEQGANGDSKGKGKGKGKGSKGKKGSKGGKKGDKSSQDVSGIEMDSYLMKLAAAYRDREESY